MKQAIILYLSFTLIIAGCIYSPKKQTLQEKQKETGAGKLDERYVYSVKEIGWSAKLPKEWKVISKRESLENSQKGQEFIEESVGQKIDASNLIELVSIKKDEFNSFESTMEPFNEVTDGSYEDQNFKVHELIKQTYKTKKINADYEIGATRIDGVMLDWFYIKAFTPDKEKVILQQRIYSALINGYDFAMTISYNNDKDGEELMNLVNSSKFSIKNKND